MKINKVTLYNFSSFEGRNELDFTVEDNGKNIVLIGGKNGAGKTSLFSAIKVGLYGPIAFGYIGANAHYTQRVKELINSNAFREKKVEASVNINISLKLDRDVETYEISRTWLYNKQKLEEIYTVTQNGTELKNTEILYFQNYLQTVIPPDMFEFFLFDGEEIGDVFSSNNYNMYLKKAIFTLCGLDVYEILRKYSSKYVSKTNDDSLYGNIDEYETITKRIDETTIRLTEIDEEVFEINEFIKNLEVQLEEIDTSFKNAGGIPESERNRLSLELKNLEACKSRLSVEIKGFVEDIMPFIITNNFTENIQSQLDREEKIEQYKYIVKHISRLDITKILSDSKINDIKLADKLLFNILENFRPQGYDANEVSIHDLSNEHKNKVNLVNSKIEAFNYDDMLKTIKKKKLASDRTVKINEKLKKAMSEEEVRKYVELQKSINEQLLDNKTRLVICDKTKENNEKLLETLTAEKEKLYLAITENAQNKNTFELTEKVSKVMKIILEKKTNDIILKLSEYSVENLNAILSKNNLVTHVEIDDNFKFNLFQDQVYTETELIALINNVGISNFEKLLGEKGVEKLLLIYGINKISEIQNYLISNRIGKAVDLYKQVDLLRLSKGERQIFVLSIYWAIIKLSQQDIPFVIDTPYARIDAKHRAEISAKFFPNISKQVIILSTDEEITEEYYKLIKPHIAREYLLINDENSNRTTIANKYFYEV